MEEKSLLWVHKNVDFSQPRDISKKLEINIKVNGFMPNRRVHHYTGYSALH